MDRLLLKIPIFGPLVEKSVSYLFLFLNATTLRRTAAIERLRGHIRDLGDLQAGSLKGTNSSLAARTWEGWWGSAGHFLPLVALMLFPVIQMQHFCSQHRGFIICVATITFVMASYLVPERAHLAARHPQRRQAPVGGREVVRCFLRFSGSLPTPRSAANILPC